jgi:protein associated with RNAse G/E
VVDLDIDVIRYRDGRVEVEDEDEFAQHRDELGYPPEIVAGALAGAAELRAALAHGEEPFASHYLTWLARV